MRGEEHDERWHGRPDEAGAADAGKDAEDAGRTGQRRSDRQSGAGLVSVVMTGRHDVKRVSLDDSLMQEDKEILEDLIAAAVNDAVRKIEQNNQERDVRLHLGHATAARLQDALLIPAFVPGPPLRTAPGSHSLPIRRVLHEFQPADPPTDRVPAHSSRCRAEVGPAHGADAAGA
ncbi:YbaB/EbfC family nucleoid-associated protein [Pseudomonas aeruginosa]